MNQPHTGPTGNAPDPTPESLGPSQSTSIKLGYDDIDRFLEFDDWASFEGNPETPTDHQSAHFTQEEVKSALDRGDIMEALVDADNNLVAAAWYQPMSEENELYIYNLVVHPQHRDKGIGEKFLQRGEALAMAMDFKTCALNVDPLNSRALNLYFKHGYRPVAYETDTTYGLKGHLFMRKLLEGTWDINTEDTATALSGDEAGLQWLLDNSYIGIEIEPDPSRNPYNNVIKFARLIDKAGNS